MAGIIASVADDIKKLQELKQAIADVKGELKGINIKVDINIKENLEKQLQSLMEQYNAVAARISEVEGKVIISAQNISKCTEQIINAQNAITAMASQQISQPVNQTDGQQNIVAENQQVTSSIQAQAKAYEELKEAIEDISGTRNQNIVLMLREGEKLKSYQKELKELEKAPKTDDTVEKIAQITDEIERSKIVISDYRRSIKNDLKIETSVSSSMNELSQQLGKMRSVYRDLTEEERNSPFGKELLVSIQQADAKIKELDASIGNHQRNVGNYGSAFDSVRGKLNEFASSASTIPGPVGNIASSIQGMTKASLAFIATPLGLVLAAISAALAAVSSWFHRTEEGENALNVATAAFSGTLNTLLDVVDNVGEWLFKCFTKPKEALSDLVDFLKGQLINRLKAVAKGAEAIFKIFSGDMSGIEEFRNAWMQGLTGIEDAGKKYDSFIKKSVSNAKERAKLAERQNVLDRKERENLVEKAKLEQKISELRAKGMDSSVSEKERAKAIKEASKLTNKMYNDEIALAKEKYEIIKKTNSLSHSNKADKEKEAQAEARLYQLESQRNNNQRMLTRQSNRVQSSQNQQARKELNMANATTKANEKLDEIIRKNAEERVKLTVNLEESVTDARIKAMEDGAEKLRAERERQNEKELKQIEEQRKAAIESERKRQKQEFDAKQDVIKAKGGQLTQWDESMMDTTIIDQINTQYKEIADNVSKAQENTLMKAEIAAMRDYLKEYGTYQQQKLVIAQEYAEKIAKAQNEGERLTLEKQREKALRDKADEQVISKVDWVAAFGNLGTAFESVIKDTLAELDAYIQTDEFRIRSAEDKKTILDAQKNLQGKVSNDATFEKLNKQIEEYRVNVQTLSMAEKVHQSAINDLTAAEQHRDSITDKSSKEYADASKKVAEAQKEVERTAELVTTANNTVAESQGRVSSTAVQLQGNLEKMSQGINQLTSGTLAGTVSGLENLIKGLGGSTAAIDKFKDVLKTGLSAVFGEQVGGLMAESLDIVEGVLTGDMTEAVVSGVLGMVDNILEGILKGGFITKPVKALVDGLGSIANTITFGGFNSWFGVHGNEKDVRETIDRLTERNEILTSAIDRLTDELDKTGGMKAVDVAKKAEEQQKKKEQNLLDIMKAQMGYHSAHHSWNYYWGGFSQKQIADFSEQIGRAWDGALASLTADEAAKLLENSDMVELIKNTGKGGYGRSVLEKLKDYAAEAGVLQEIEKQLYESLTQISFDSLRNDFISSLMDMEKSAEDFSEDFTKMLMQSVLNARIADELNTELEGFYKEWAERSKDGLNDKDIDALKAQWDGIVQAGIAIRDEVAEVTGFDNVSKESSQQTATSKGFQAMSQDTGEELNGRFTALQIAGEEIKTQNVIQSQSLNILTMRADDILSVQTETRNIANDMRDIIANSYLELVQISENTGNSAKYLKDIKADIAEVKRNTSRL